MSDARDRPAVRLELENERAWCGDRLLDLPPKVFAVLRHFVEHRDRLVTKDDLMNAVWGDTVVSEAALTSCIRDLRRALADTSRAPRYVETVHRRGFRFIGPVGAARPATPARADPADRSPIAIVGRAAELERVRARFDAACAGRRGLVFVTGEAGIGKTTLVETFLAEIEPGRGVRVGRGQCVEQYGPGEAYLPVLEALARLARAPDGDAVVGALRQYAPAWLVQLPGVLSDDDLEAVRRRAQGASGDRMLRELAEALEVVGRDVPLVLLLEDLHWSDAATVDLLAMLARRRDPARLLILATYRPADVAAGAHPLKPVKQELQAHGDCDDVSLDFLDETAVTAYLDGRFGGTALAPGFARFLHRNTSGNPLFLANVVDHLVARGHVRDDGGLWRLTVPLDDLAAEIPDSLWQLVEKQIDRLTAQEQAVLAVGSIAGAEFSAALAVVDGIDPPAAETCCAALARRGQFLRATGVAAWPDGTVAGRFAFVHALHRHVLAERVATGHRVALHLRIGARLELAHGGRAGEIAGELAMHFEHGRDFERAIHYRRLAADNALRHHGHREAASHAGRALALLQEVPESADRIRRELAVYTQLGAALIAKGWAAPEVAETYARARALCLQVGPAPELFPILIGLFGFYVTRAELAVAAELAGQLAQLAAATDDGAIALGAYNATGMVAFYGGDFTAALAALERGMAVYDPAEHNPNRSPAFWGGHDAGVSCAVHAAWALWVLGHPTRAGALMQTALDWARAAEHPFTLAFACHFAASFYECRREADVARVLAEEGLAQAREHGFELFASLGAVHDGWQRADAGEIRAGVAAYRQTGSRFGLPTYLALLADVSAQVGEADGGLAVVEEGLTLAADCGAHYWDAELARLRGTLTAARAATAERNSVASTREVDASFRNAIETARRQQAKTLELRAVTDLNRIWHLRGKSDEARASLSAVYGWFTEGHETPDLREAKVLLDRLGPTPRRRR